MTVLDIRGEDVGAIKRLHGESGFDYRFPPDFSTPLFPIRRMVKNGTGKPLAAAALKVEAEAYLWLDSTSGSPKMRWAALQMLHRDLAEKALHTGFDQVHCALPPEVAERFGKRLEDLGWQLARPWPLYVFQLR